MPVDTVEYSPLKLRAKRDGKANQISLALVLLIASPSDFFPVEPAIDLATNAAVRDSDSDRCPASGCVRRCQCHS
jgi:hypothetical protein